MDFNMIDIVSMVCHNFTRVAVCAGPEVAFAKRSLCDLADKAFPHLLPGDCAGVVPGREKAKRARLERPCMRVAKLILRACTEGGVAVAGTVDDKFCTHSRKRALFRTDKEPQAAVAPHVNYRCAKRQRHIFLQTHGIHQTGRHWNIDLDAL